MDISQPNRFAMKNILVGVIGISQSIDFASYPEGYIIFEIMIYLERGRKPKTCRSKRPVFYIPLTLSKFWENYQKIYISSF